ncbi:AmpG protein [Granulibacter bethesdensis]|uniref:AmpG protein n=1 Tax=Granulibacter bethesdensis TaxID=364410 RepID=A0AAN0RFJ6_9PROT|nr:MFS transporter [Granulibacter bethesdensis]AHJ64014.1 AmpG protein [Granulibacter bethesdensis]
MVPRLAVFFQAGHDAGMTGLPPPDDAAGAPGAATISVTDRRLWLIGLYGLASGLPFPLCHFTLGQWMSDSGLSLQAIGLSSLITLAYSLKFLWSPVADYVRPPGPLRRLGRRRGWLLFVQAVLTTSILAMAMTDPHATPFLTIGLAASMAFFSASQDIVIDAWRIETFGRRGQGPALAGYVWGYRMALLIGNAGVIGLASLAGWHVALLAVGALSALGMVVTLLATEPAIPSIPETVTLETGWQRRLHAMKAPLADMLRKPYSIAALCFVTLFHLGEALAGKMLPPYYRAMGYQKADVAFANTPSLFAGLAGVAAGGWLQQRMGTMRALVLTGCIQTLAILIYLALGYAQGSRMALVGTVAVEAFVGGLASASFLSYLSGLCTPRHSATQYALLSSLSALPLNTVAGASGFLAVWLGWHGFYAACTLSALPAMAIMIWLATRPDGGDQAEEAVCHSRQPSALSEQAGHSPHP